jgi:3-deoxy-7-phosphoheptulonate synthase
MIVVMKAEVGPDSPEVDRVVEMARRYPDVQTEVRAIQGTTRALTEVYLLGATAGVPKDIFEEFPSVEKVIRIRARYRAIGRHDGEAEAVGFEYRGVQFTQDSLHIFAGLCAVDTSQNVETVFRALKTAGLQTARAGAYKPRTSPYDFQGHGAACLPYVFELAGKYGIRVLAMEVLRESHVDEIDEALELAGHPTGVMLQIGTRNAQNFELLKAVGQRNDYPVLFKRGMGIPLEESLNAAEYIASSGNSRIIFCLRGMRSELGDPHRNFVDFAHVPVVKRLTRVPVGIDPSHSVGKKVKGPDGLLDIFHVTAQGVIAGANLVLVDLHPRPDQALCDGPQALLTEELPHFVEDVHIVREALLARRRLAERHATPPAVTAG